MIKVLIFIQFLAILCLIYISGYRNYHVEKANAILTEKNITLNEVDYTKANEIYLAKVGEKDAEIKRLIGIIQNLTKEDPSFIRKMEGVVVDLNSVFEKTSKMIELTPESPVASQIVKEAPPVRIIVKEVDKETEAELIECRTQNNQLKDWYNKYKKTISN